jgi:hypothetical protein
VKGYLDGNSPDCPSLTCETSIIIRDRKIDYSQTAHGEAVTRKSIGIGLFICATYLIRISKEKRKRDLE